MAIFELPVRSDLPAFSFKAELDLVVYTFDFRFNERFDCWVMDVSSETGDPILMGIPVQTEVDITSRFLDERLPPGQFVVLDETGNQRDPDRISFGNEVKLFYLDRAELSP